MAAPGVVGVRDAGDVLRGQVAVGSVRHVSELAGVDEQYLSAAVAAVAVAPPAGQEPQAGGYLGRSEELAGQCDDAVDEVGLDQVLADLALARLARRHGAVGEHEAGDPAGRQMVQEVLHPGEVGVARRRDAVLPSLVVSQTLSAPVGDVEGRIGEDVVGPQVGVPVVVEAVAVLDLAHDATYRQIHPGHPPGGVVGLLAVDGDVALGFAPVCRCPLAWARMNSTDCTNMPDEPQHGS